MHTHSPGVLVSVGFCILKHDGHLQPRLKIWAAADVSWITHPLGTATDTCWYVHTFAHLHLPHTPQYVCCALEKQSALQWKRRTWERAKQKMRCQSSPLPPCLSSSSSSSYFFSLAGWAIYIEQDPILATAAGDSASQGQPVLPPCTIFSSRTASNSSTELFLSLCFALSAAAAPAKGIGCVFVFYSGS